MIRFRVRAWSAWAPGLHTSADWLRWAAAPAAPELAGHPELKFLPAMQRRRFSRLSKLALQVAFDALPPELLRDACTVFASRHGEASACVALLADIARSAPLSPTAFSHSVHNAQGGLFSIAAANGAPSSALAAGRDTFCAGLVEALGLCQRHPGRPTLLVVADEPMPRAFAEFQDEVPCAYALALLLEPAGAGDAGIRMELDASPRVEARAGVPAAERFPATADEGGAARFGAGTRAGSSARTVASAAERAAEPAPEPRLPQALEFLAWLLAGSGPLALGGGRRGWSFEKPGP